MKKFNSMFDKAPEKGKEQKEVKPVVQKTTGIKPRLVVEIDDRETLNKFKSASTLNGLSMRQVILDYIKEYIK